MDKTVYICTGGCGAVINEEQYNAGLQKCGAEGCPNKGHAFEKRKQCSFCSAVYKEEEKHTHAN